MITNVSAIAQKELRGFFRSAVGIIFLGLFLAATIFTFFWLEKFFARGVTDIRPLFERMPVLLILLVSALTMRLWSEEHKTGTFEILATLPVPTHQLVLGKFLSGLALVAIALLLTFPIPVAVALMGNLDWGPVFGGYFATVLLASTYLAIGSCISATTNNQIVSLFGTGLACAFLYLLGSDVVADNRGVATGQLLRSLGAGSRFDSVARGVIDLRDLGYYVGLTTFFLVVNVIVLVKRGWGVGETSRRQRKSAWILVALVAANVVALNVWLHQVRRARLDLTADRQFSLSPVTQELLASLDEKLVIRGFFSASVHPILDPQIPQVLDTLREYEAVGGDSVTVEFSDPDTDEELQNELSEQYQISPMPALPFETRRGAAYVKPYFSILFEYGDQHTVLGLFDLLGPEANFGNLEYEFTKAIKKTIYGFQSVDSMFATLGEPVDVVSIVSTDVAPQLAKDLGTIKTVVQEFADKSQGQLTYREITPKTAEEQRTVLTEYGVEPFAVLTQTETGLAMQSVYKHVLVNVGKRRVLLNPPDNATEDQLREAFESAFQQATPGFITTVGLVTPPAPPMNPQMMQMGMGQPPPPPQSFRELQNTLSEAYQVTNVSLGSGNVDEIVDVLIIAGPDNIDTTGQKAIDQFLMRGGKVIVLAGSHRDNQELTADPVKSGLDELLRTYGVVVEDKVVHDQGDVYLAHDPMRRGYEPIKAPYVLPITGDSLAKHISTSGVPGLLLHFASPLEILDKEGIESEVLLTAAKSTWLEDRPGGTGPAADPSGEKNGKSDEPYALAVVLTGTFSSHFAKSKEDLEKQLKEQPLVGGESDDVKSTSDTERLLRQSPPDARLAVVGSSSFVADVPLAVSSQTMQIGGSKFVQFNLPFLMNLIEWATADTDLLKIRGRAASTRLLAVDESAYGKWEYGTYAVSLLLLAGIFLVTILRRRTLVPMVLDSKSKIVPGDKNQ